MGKMNYPLRCRCGSVAGYLLWPGRAGRALCYCRDCQAFARYLGTPEQSVDEFGGTDVIATSPRYVHFTQGIERMHCMSLSEKGLLRWYAACCRTPVGNTPRNPKLSYVGLVHDFLEGSNDELREAFGPARAAVNTQSATGSVSSAPVATFFAVQKILGNVLWSRISGKYRENPFFRPGSATPIVAPEVLSLAQRRALS
jgi:Family of unknown function (DUF6151)